MCTWIWTLELSPPPPRQNKNLSLPSYWKKWIPPQAELMAKSRVLIRIFGGKDTMLLPTLIWLAKNKLLTLNSTSVPYASFERWIMHSGAISNIFLDIAWRPSINLAPWICVLEVREQTNELKYFVIQRCPQIILVYHMCDNDSLSSICFYKNDSQKWASWFFRNAKNDLEIF